MKGIFSYDSFLFQAINRFLDSIAICLLWAVFCLPIITAGAATTALFYTADKVIFREEGRLLATFWQSFKDNFKQATLIGLLFGLLFCFLYLDVFYSYTLYSSGYLHIALLGVILVVTALILAWSAYVFPYIGKYTDTTKQAFKKCAMMALGNLPWSLLILAVICVSFIMFRSIPGGFILAPVACLMSISRITARVFRKYPEQSE